MAKTTRGGGELEAILRSHKPRATQFTDAEWKAAMKERRKRRGGKGEFDNRRDGRPHRDSASPVRDAKRGKRFSSDDTNG